MLRASLLRRLALAGLAAAAILPTPATAQTRQDLPAWLLNPSYFSRRDYEKKAVMDGNEVAITVFNTGLLGGVGEVRGTWPRSAATGQETNYVGDVNPVIALEVPVKTRDGRDSLVRHAVTQRGPRAGTNSPPGNPNIFWGFEPKPGFASDRTITLANGTTERNSRLALSTDENTWPDRWPDQPTWIDPASGRAQWNGYFGRNIKNADLETYFWTDDQNDAELYQATLPYTFRADSTSATRRGQGLALKVRGLQWSQFLAQDAIFWLYEVTNTSTTTYPRVAVGLTVGTLAGGDGDSSDDLAFFDQANRIVYSWDSDGLGNNRQKVGYVGYGFLESPGDALNGIDDDGDGDPSTDLGVDIDGNPYVKGGLEGSSNTFTSADFQPRVLASGSPLVLIDAATNRRSVVYLGAGAQTVTSQGRRYTIAPGQTLREDTTRIQGQLQAVTVTERNLVDEDLDGIVDEDANLHFVRRAQEFGTNRIITLPALRYKNYVGFFDAIRNRTATRSDSVTFGLLNPMIDEGRDDGIDNDGDWEATSDDVGADGLPGTGDAGEGNGRPDPGEPNFDALDVSESDQVGLTSFFYFTPPGAVRMNDDNRLWSAMAPGFFTTNAELQAQQAGGGVDGDFIFGSGYFRLQPGQTLRFTMALVFGADLADITNNAQTIQEIYNRNYQFARPPERPTLRAVAGDKRVTLYWDTKAEESVDPILGHDFEGYKLIKSTDPFFRDPAQVTDAFGNPAIVTPMIQYDLSNGVTGFWQPTDPTLYNRVRGTPYYLGNDTGVPHSYVDTLVQNGRRYYYALVAYDRGSAAFYPAENNIPVTVDESGNVITGSNVVEVIPNAAAAGYVAGTINGTVTQTAGRATGDVIPEVLDPMMLKQGARYNVRFTSTNGAVIADSFRVFRNDTLIAAAPISASNGTVFDGIRLNLVNDATSLNADSTRWITTPPQDTLRVTTPFRIQEIGWTFTGSPLPYDYELRYGDPSTSLAIKLGTGTRAPTTPARATQFSVYNTTTGQKVPFALDEGTSDGRLNGSGGIEFVYPYERVKTARGTDTLVAVMEIATQVKFTEPATGSRFRIKTNKPFGPTDRYTFTVNGSTIDAAVADADMDKIRAVPNPYVVGNAFERPLAPTVTSGRGERVMYFTHLPAGSTIRIFTVRGDLVRELQHDGALDDGTVTWNLKTREDLDVAYGVYFYHVTAPGGRTKTGRIAIIK